MLALAAFLVSLVLRPETSLQNFPAEAVAAWRGAVKLYSRARRTASAVQRASVAASAEFRGEELAEEEAGAS